MDLDWLKHLIEHFTPMLTTAKATSCGVLFSVCSWLTQENIVFFLTVAVLLCQLAAWAWKFSKWWRSRK